MDDKCRGKESLEILEGAPKGSSLRHASPTHQPRLLLTSRVNDETALSPLMDDFASTAALIEQLDFVMTIDTDLAHLAETLSKPTWLLLSAASD